MTPVSFRETGPCMVFPNCVRSLRSIVLPHSRRLESLLTFRVSSLDQEKAQSELKHLAWLHFGFLSVVNTNIYKLDILKNSNHDKKVDDSSPDQIK